MKISEAMKAELRYLDRETQTWRGRKGATAGCTASALALVKRGLAEQVKVNAGGWPLYRLTPAGRSLLDEVEG